MQAAFGVRKTPIPLGGRDLPSPAAAPLGYGRSRRDERPEKKRPMPSPMPPPTTTSATPRRPSLRQPAILLATWFGSGYLPRMPGTWGSLAALPVAWPIHAAWGLPGLAVAAVLVFAAGVWASSAYMARSGGGHDPGAIVVDEVAGMWLTLLAAGGGPEPLPYLAAFVLFRIFDVAKPWPVSLADRRIGGGLGVMLDDVLAAGYAAAALYALRLLTSQGGLA